MSGIELRCSTVADDECLRAFLDAAGLPSADVEAGRQEYLLACDAGHLIGSIGLELVGEDGLLRSLAVVPEWRGRGIAGRLHEAVLGLAHLRNARTLYLLTTTAGSYAAKKGFEPLPRTEVPPAILGLAQFRALCPATALCMRYRLL